jgi:hypothetical protein
MSSTLGNIVFIDFMKKLESEDLSNIVVDKIKHLLDTQDVVTDEKIIGLIQECLPNIDGY